MADIINDPNQYGGLSYQEAVQLLSQITEMGLLTLNKTTIFPALANRTYDEEFNAYKHGNHLLIPVGKLATAKVKNLGKDSRTDGGVQLKGVDTDPYEMVGSTADDNNPFSLKGQSATASLTLLRRVFINKAISDHFVIDWKQAKTEVANFYKGTILPQLSAWSRAFDNDASNAIADASYYTYTKGDSLNPTTAAHWAAQMENLGQIPDPENTLLIVDPEDMTEVDRWIQGSGQNVGNFTAPNVPQYLSNELNSLLRHSFKGMLGGAHTITTNAMPEYKLPVLGVSAPKVKGTKGYPTASSSSGFSLKSVNNLEFTEVKTDGWSTSLSDGDVVLNRGNIISFDGVNAVCPVDSGGTHKRTGQIATFVVADDATTDGSGNANILIEPLINDGTVKFNGKTLDAYKNVTALPADNAIVRIHRSGQPTSGGDNGKILSTNSSSSNERYFRQVIRYHRSALEVINIPLPEIMGSVNSVVYDPLSGIKIAAAATGLYSERLNSLRIDAWFKYFCVQNNMLSRMITTEIS